MSKHLANLQRLFVKLQVRYGDDDESVRDVGAQLKALEELESNRKKLRADSTGVKSSRARSKRATVPAGTL